MLDSSPGGMFRLSVRAACDLSIDFHFSGCHIVSATSLACDIHGLDDKKCSPCRFSHPECPKAFEVHSSTRWHH